MLALIVLIGGAAIAWCMSRRGPATALPEDGAPPADAPPEATAGGETTTVTPPPEGPDVPDGNGPPEPSERPPGPA